MASNPERLIELNGDKKVEYKVLTDYPQGVSQKTVTHRAPGKRLRRQCLARIHGGCDGGLSKEHVVSKSVLGVLPQLAFTDQQGKSVQIKDNNATLKILCRRHNSAISQIDNEAAGFFQQWINLMHSTVPNLTLEGTLPTEYKGDYQCLGMNIENWLLKTFLYMTIVQSRSENESTFFPTAPLGLVDCLSSVFTKKDSSPPFGLYVVDPPVTKIQSLKKFGFSLARYPIELFQQPDSIDHMVVPYGLNVCLFGTCFFGFFNITSIPNEQLIENVSEFLGINSIQEIGSRHPSKINIKNNDSGRENSIRLRWD